MKEREGVALMDDGQAAPLYPKGPSYGGGVLHGTDALDPSPLRRWKAAAVISMLEKKCGEDTFKKLLERLLMNAINGDARGEQPSFSLRIFSGYSPVAPLFLAWLPFAKLLSVTPHSHSNIELNFYDIEDEIFGPATR
jgi:hypothetical protein